MLKLASAVPLLAAWGGGGQTAFAPVDTALFGRLRAGGLSVRSALKVISAA